ncbi:AAA family ATPase [Arthrobacter ginsengisoli]|nr:AAA family ATPase [Arthrobacter ginsengisoli]
MPAIEEEIVSWLNSRSGWMKVLTGQLLAGHDVDDAFVESLASDLVGKKELQVPAPFVVKDLPTSASTGSRVELTSVSGLLNVNALADGGTLNFGSTGLTVIYGDNGSGKSGYARLVKDVVGARHRDEILPNAFNPGAPKKQAAVITYRVNGQDRSLAWPDDVDPELRQVHFHDEPCGDHYLVNDTELSYRPPALTLFDKLITATDALRAAVDCELGKVDTAKYAVPGLQASTNAGLFAASVSPDTTDDQIDEATKLPDDAETELATLVQNEARLLSTNPAKEKTRLANGAKGLDSLAQHFDSLEGLLSPKACQDIEQKLSTSRSLRMAADLASKTSFTEEPLDGVGTETWRALWEAAEAYSQAEVYPDHDFPHTETDARCPLCQQELGADAANRLGRFKAFVHDDTAKKAKSAEGLAKRSVDALKQLEVVTVETTNALAFVEAESPKLASELRAALDTAADAKKRIGERLRGESEEQPVALAAVDSGALRAEAITVRERAAKVDETAFATQLKAATHAKLQLKDKIDLAEHAGALKKDVERRRTARDITAIRNAISTQPITKQSIALTRTHVNEVVNDRFSRESDRLGLEHVKLDDKGGGKGKLRHKPALLGATLATKTVRDVLSEGEQTALGLAGLFTEINFDESESALVLDDPINSLDHGRREKVSRRIAALASKRQVIVFTHDLTFLGDLIRAADEAGVALQERSIAKDNARVPGRVLETHPWKAKDAKKRIGDLRTDLARLKKDAKDMTPEEYENRVQLWAGLLSETWERIVRNDIVGKVVDRGTTEVRPKMVKLLAQITTADNDEFQSAYSQVSKWAPRHDKSEEVNFVAPTVDEMEVELARIDGWHKRLVTYVQN